MGKHTLGLYLNEDYITAVVTEFSGKTRSVSAFGLVPCEEEGPLATSLDELLDRLNWSGGEVICGVPLSWISVRNIELPFSDKKNITQTLPFELDDQLIRPVHDLVTDFSVLDAGNDKSRILTFTIEKEKLHGLLAHIGQYGLEPSAVVPAAVPLTSVVGREQGNAQVLYIHVDTAAYCLALIKDGACQFCRNLPFTEQTLSSLYGDNQEQRCNVLSASLRRSIGFLRTIGFPPEAFDKVCVSGQLIQDDILCDHIAASLALPLERLSPMQALGVGDQLEVGDFIGEYETALSLSFYRDFIRSEYNLRQGEFALQRSLFRSKKQLAAGGLAIAALLALFLGYFALDQKRLAAENTQLSEQMKQIYREQFPAATRIQDPYVQMQVALRGVEATESEVPIYAGNQRTLDFLADISSRIPEKISLQVSRMVVDNKAVRMRGVTETFNAVDEIKNLLARSPLYTDVQIVSATADKKSQKIRFEIQLDLGEGVMQLSQREKRAVAIAGLCLVLFVVAQFILFPVLDSRKKLAKSLAGKQRQLLEMQSMRQRYASFSEKNDSIAELLTQRATGFSLFSFLEKNAAESQVKDRIAYMKPSSLTDNALLQQSMVEMKLQAVSIKQLVTFLEMTESPQKLVGIKRITIQENSKQKGALDIIMQIVSVDGLGASG